MWSGTVDWFDGSNAKPGLRLGVGQDPSSNIECRSLSFYNCVLRQEIAGKCTVVFARGKTSIFVLLRSWGGLAVLVGAGEDPNWTIDSMTFSCAIGHSCDADDGYYFTFGQILISCRGTVPAATSWFG